MYIVQYVLALTGAHFCKILHTQELCRVLNVQRKSFKSTESCLNMLNQFLLQKILYNNGYKSNPKLHADSKYANFPTRKMYLIKLKKLTEI